VPDRRPTERMESVTEAEAARIAGAGETGITGDPGSGHAERDDLAGPHPLVSDSFVRASFTLEQLRTFLAVAGREHVTQAASMLRLSQSAVTQQVHLLERALGIQLIERVGRNIRLTTTGTQVASAALLIMRAVENLDDVVRAARGLDWGCVSVGATGVTGTYYLPEYLVGFALAHPGIQVNVTAGSTAEICDRVAKGQLDCAIVDSPLPKTHPEHVLLAADDALLVSNPRHALSRREQLSPRHFAGQRYLLYDQGSSIEALAAEMLGPAYGRLSISRVPGLEGARQYLLHDAEHIAIMPGRAVADDLRRGSLARLAITPRRQFIYALRRGASAEPAIGAFWRIVTGNADIAAT
jgi:DNA-binding transcriptional LysR family regulator